MEEQKKVKKSSAPIYVMIFAVLLIVAGVVLIVTDNNKSFWEKKEPKKENEQEKQEEENEETPNRGLIPPVVTEEEVLQLINNTKLVEYPEENYGVDFVTLIAHDEENEKILVSYGEFQADASVVVKQTIVSILNGEKSVELPGWIEGERDLTVYNFIMYDEDETFEPNIDLEGPVLEDEDILLEDGYFEDSSNLDE